MASRLLNTSDNKFCSLHYFLSLTYLLVYKMKYAQESLFEMFQVILFIQTLLFFILISNSFVSSSKRSFRFKD